MKILLVCVVLNLGASNFLLAQDVFSSTLKDATTKEILDQASVVNLKSRAYTFANERGLFTIKAMPVDTLYIERLGYVPLKIVARDLKEVTYMSTDLTTLDMITLEVKKPIELGDNQRDSDVMGLSYLGSYGFKVYVKEHAIVEELVIPIKMKAGGGKLGTITFQPYSVINGHELGLPLASPIIISNIETLRKNISLNFNDFRAPDQQFYLIINRFLPENQVQDDTESFSLNPYLKFAATGTEWDYIYKYVGETKWISSKPFYKTTRPKLTVQVLGRVLEE